MYIDAVDSDQSNWEEFLTQKCQINGPKVHVLDEKSAIIHKLHEESGIWQGGALNLSQALPASKQLNLNKLSDADGSQIQWLSDAARNRLFM